MNAVYIDLDKSESSGPYGPDPDHRAAPVRHHAEYVALPPEVRGSVDAAIGRACGRAVTARREDERVRVYEWTSDDRGLYWVKEVEVVSCDEGSAVRTPAVEADCAVEPDRTVERVGRASGERGRRSGLFKLVLVASVLTGWSLNTLLAGGLGVVLADRVKESGPAWLRDASIRSVDVAAPSASPDRHHRAMEEGGGALRPEIRAGEAPRQDESRDVEMPREQPGGGKSNVIPDGYVARRVGSTVAIHGVSQGEASDGFR